MRNGFLGSLAMLLAAVLPAMAQSGPVTSTPGNGVTLPWSSGVCASPSTSGVCAGAACTPGAPLGCTASPACDSCGPEGRIWARAEYLMWWTKGASLPPLVTAGIGTSAGVLGQTGTAELFGGSVNDRMRSGGMFTLGGWFDEEHLIGAQASYFFLASQSTRFSSGGTGDPSTLAISRPFFDVSRNAQNAELVAYPNVARGVVSVDPTTNLQGWSPSLIVNLCCESNYRADALVGFRYLELRDNLNINEDLSALAGASTTPGTRFQVHDSFNTRNEFYGGNVGVQGEWRCGKIFVNGMASVALGDSHESVGIGGSTIITAPGSAPTVNNGGLLALPSNIGHSTRDRFAVVPEAGLRVGYQITPNIRASVGYSFTYWSDVERPGKQIDFAIDPRQLPRSGGMATGGTSPARTGRSEDFWAQGVNFGVEIRY